MTTRSDGYIFVRINTACYGDNLCLVGSTENIFTRDLEITENEVKIGYFSLILEVNDISQVHRTLRYEFSELNVSHGGGKDFYKKSVLDSIEPLLKKYGFDYRKLTETEIKDIYASTTLKLNEREELKKKEFAELDQAELKK